MKLRLTTRVIILFAILAIEVSTFMLFNYIIIERQGRKTIELHDGLKRIELIKNFQFSIIDSVTYVIDSMHVKDHEAVDHKSLKETEAVMSTLDELGFFIPQEKELFNFIKSEYIVFKEKFLTLKSVSLDNEKEIYKDEIRSLANDIISDAGKFYDIAFSDIDISRLDLAYTEKKITRFFVIGFLFNLMVVLFAFVNVRKKILTPLIMLKDANLAVRDGNMNARTNFKEGDEMGELSESFNMMVKEMKRARETLENKNLELDIAKKSAEELAKGMEVKAYEVSVFHEIFKAISYTLNYKKLFEILTGKLLSNIVGFDICAYIIKNVEDIDISIKPVSKGSASLADDVVNSLVNSFSKHVGYDIDIKKDNINISVEHFYDFSIKSEKDYKDAFKSFLSIPFVINKRVVGIIYIASFHKDAFSDEKAQLLFNISKQSMQATENMRKVINNEKSKMEKLVFSMRDGIIMFDEQAELVLLNPAAIKMLALSNINEVTARDVNEKFTEYGLDKDISLCWKGNDKDFFVKEIELEMGVCKFLRFELTPVFNEGNMLGVCIVVHDITKATELDRMKSEFVSIISHELRTPLSSIKNSINIILEEAAGPITEDQKRFLMLGERNINRLKSIVDELLDISKIEAQKLKVNFEKADLADLINSVVDTLDTNANKKTITLTRSSNIEGAPFVYADPDRVAQILFNLVGNAIKFTDEGGAVSVFSKTIKIKNQHNESSDEFIEITVEDTGIGIANEDIDKVFDKFHQVASAAKRKEGGTGLGLAIVKNLVELNFGTIRVSSVVGKGSRFIFALPKYSNKRAFVSHVNNEIKQAETTGYPFSVIILNLDCKVYGSDTKKILTDFFNVVKGALRRSDDNLLSISPDDRLIAVVVQIDNEKAASLHSRIKNILVEQFFSEYHLLNLNDLYSNAFTYLINFEDVSDLFIKAVKKV